MMEFAFGKKKACVKKKKSVFFMEKDGQMKISFTDKRFSRAKSVDILSQTSHEDFMDL